MERSPRAEPWARKAEEVLAELAVDSREGLDEREILRRRERHGPNVLREAPRRSAWRILSGQFRSPIVALLGAAAGLAFAFGEWVEGAAILAVLAINAALGFFAELRATRSMEALRELARVSARVRRGGRVLEVASEELVPGDVVLVEGGDVVSADLRIVEAARLEANESTLTGESVPVAKSPEPVGAEAQLGDRACMLFKGTAITRGSGSAVVVATGMQTQLGGIAEMVARARKEEATPLERRLARLGQRLIGITLAVAAATMVAGVLAGREVFLMVETGIALAVAAIPEGLPIVATIALARGMWRMARRNALVNRLSAVETLGATSVILTDKTGTLTENRMTAVRYALADGDVAVSGEGLAAEGEFQREGTRVDAVEDELLLAALEVGVLCNHASLELGGGGPRATGDPLEVALLVAGAKAGLARAELLEDRPEAEVEPFDTSTKKMATFHADGDGCLVAVKGAPEAVLECCARILRREGERELTPEEREGWLEKAARLADEGLRMLGLARKRAESASADPYAHLTWLGLVGLLDPPRSDVRGALEACRRAGIRVVVVTGDHAATARSIARAVGLVGDDEEIVTGKELARHFESPEGRRRLLETTVFARVDPRQKLDLVELHQREGRIVAMTGDGVNDAPALEKADIGVAMGVRGTQVAKDASDMVLTDDAFASIVAAVRQGRVIFRNVRRFVVYLLSCNASEIAVLGIASAVPGLPLPALPLQILFLNLVTDVFPALALAMGEGDPRELDRPPRPADEPIVGARHWRSIAGYGLLMTGSVVAALLLSVHVLGFERERAITVSFLTLAFAQLWHVFDMRGKGSRLVRNDVVRSPWVWGAVALCTALLFAATYLPGLSDVLRTKDPGAQGWLAVAAFGLLPSVVGQLWLVIASRRTRRVGDPEPY